MEIRVLKYFLTIVNEGTITGASEVLHITQPTLTRQIHDLEKELNCKLFIRTKKKIQLTREGALFKENVIDILNKVDETQSRFTKFNKSISGNVNIGGNESFQICALAKVIKAVQKEYPNIRINLHTGSIKDIINLLDENKLDFASVVQSVNMSKFESIEFKDEDVWGLIMRKDSPLAKKTYVTKEDILNIPLMLPIHVTNSLFSNQESIYEKWIGKKNLKDLNIIVTYNLLYNASVMVKAGLGYALALKGIINTEKDNSLCFRPLEPILTSKCKIAWKQNKNFSPAASVFLQKLKELFLTKNT